MARGASKRPIPSPIKPKKQPLEWPMRLDYSDVDCQRILRKLELETYSNLVSTFRAQGELTPEKRKLLKEMQVLLKIPLERHLAEVRRIVNDEKLYTVAYSVIGKDTSAEWRTESKRLIPPMSRNLPKTQFYTLANAAANLQAVRNSSMPDPDQTGHHSVLLEDSPADLLLPPEPKAEAKAEKSRRSIKRPANTIAYDHDHPYAEIKSNPHVPKRAHL